MTPDAAHVLALLEYINLVALRAELEAAQPGQPRAQAYDGDRTSSGQGPADPTGNAAGQEPPAVADLERYHQAVARYQAGLDQAYRNLLTLAALQERYNPPHARPRSTAKAETKGCELHRRAGIDEHRPARFTTDFADVLDVPLKAPLPVCRWCYDFPRRLHPTTGVPLGRLATPEEIRTYERTGKLRLVTKRRGAA